MPSRWASGGRVPARRQLQVVDVRQVAGGQQHLVHHDLVAVVEVDAHGAVVLEPGAGQAGARPDPHRGGGQPVGEPRLHLQPTLGPEPEPEVLLLRRAQPAEPPGVGRQPVDHRRDPGPVGGREGRRVVAVHDVHLTRPCLGQQRGPLEGALPAADQQVAAVARRRRSPPRRRCAASCPAAAARPARPATRRCGPIPRASATVRARRP